MPVKQFKFKCSQCGAEKTSTRHDQRGKEIVFCSRECRYAYFRKDTWENAGSYIQRGYRMLRRNVGGKYEHKFEHIFVWERENGRIPKGFEIHHINGNKLDNRIENLQLISIANHRQFHHKGHKWYSGTITGKIA